jgi:hypothetical protein
MKVLVGRLALTRHCVCGAYHAKLALVQRFLDAWVLTQRSPSVSLHFLAPDPECHKIENQLQIAIRDVVNRSTRKLFAWGGLADYQQPLNKNRTLANNVKEAHHWLRQIVAVFRYPQDPTLTISSLVNKSLMKYKICSIALGQTPNSSVLKAPSKSNSNVPGTCKARIFSIPMTFLVCHQTACKLRVSLDGFDAINTG